MPVTGGSSNGLYIIVIFIRQDARFFDSRYTSTYATSVSLASSHKFSGKGCEERMEKGGVDVGLGLKVERKIIVELRREKEEMKEEMKEQY